jgi:hypothetical protein
MFYIWKIWVIKLRFTVWLTVADATTFSMLTIGLVLRHTLSAFIKENYILFTFTFHQVLVNDAWIIRWQQWIYEDNYELVFRKYGEQP